ncbi:adenosylcobinamide-phosphate synthase CbiB [bacterium]|nr:cobalamin biosynthesis protein CobD [bacterium]MBU3955120.1 adenosylcobinamide-phosphate synthase CbiB [bacterium]
MKETALIVILAFLLDILLGDPVWLPHPVRFIGKIVNMLEPLIRKNIKNQRWSGVIFACGIIIFTGLSAFLIIRAAWMINNYAGIIVSVLLAYSTISVKDLKDETMPVYCCLKKGDINGARKSLSMIVGRDTRNLNENEIVKAAVETIAENTNDGIIAPLFYLIAGGPVAAVIYKVINTLDSMVGYKNERYIYFGWFSAKLDDIVNYIPARITGILITAASFITAKSFGNSFKTMIKDGRNHSSPNSGVPEAAMAGALGIRLGGNSFYNGVLCVKPYIGEERKKTCISQIKEALTVSFTASVLMVAAGAVLRSLV